jgi:hypothetical protein
MKNFNRIKKIINRIIILFFLFVFAFLTGYGQEDKCGKIEVGIYLVYFRDVTIGHLNEKYGTRTREEWYDHINMKMLETFQRNNPEVEFFYPRIDKNKDPDYMFIYLVDLTVVDKDLIKPRDSITYTDPITGWEVTDYIDAVFSEETAFHIAGRLTVNSPCAGNYRWIFASYNNVGVELEDAIVGEVMKYYRLINIIEAREQKHPVPPRGPELEIKFNKKHLSILKEEDRKMEITVKVKNCKNQYIIGQHHPQPVYFQKEVKRFKFKECDGCYRGPDYGNFAVVSIYKNHDAIGIYKVIKGVHASKEKVKIGTCGIGSDSEIFVEKELIIRGLEINVKPRKEEIYANEQTDIRITFYEVDPEGNKYPVANKKLEIKIAGIANGSISPAGEYVTDISGTTTLNYRAGDQDKNIIITASFQPPEYTEKVTGKGSVRVKTKPSYKWEGSLSINIDKTFSCNYSYHDNQNIDITDVESYGVDLRLFTDNIEIGQMMTARLDKSNIIASGEYRTAKLYEKQYNVDWKDHKIYEHETLDGENSFNLSEENISIQLFKQPGADPEKLKQKAMEAQKYGYDVEKLQEFQKEMQQMLQGTDNAKITAMIFINGPFVQKLNKTYSREETDVSGKKEEKSDEKMVELHAQPVQIKCEGQYTKDTNGMDKIVLTYTDTKEEPHGTTGSKCPPVHINVNATLNLERQFK